MVQAQRLKKLFEYVARHVGLTLDVVITDGRQPIGRGIGPALEARDVMQVLHDDADAPADLRTKALRLAGRVLEFDPDVRGGDGFALARDILDSGRARATMNAIIDAQGSRNFDWRNPPLAPLVHEVTAPADGHVTAIDCERLSRIARLAGAPQSDRRRRRPVAQDRRSGSLRAAAVPNPCARRRPNCSSHARSRCAPAACGSARRRRQRSALRSLPWRFDDSVFRR